MVFFGLSILCALVGLVLIADFAFWFLTGTIVQGTIEKFEDGKPVMTFKTIEKEGKPGETVSVKAGAVTHIGYYLASPQPGDIFNTAYRRDVDDKIHARLHGYLRLLPGVFLFVPFIAYNAITYGQALMASQLSFILVFAFLVGGAWAGLKLLRRNY